MVKIRDAMWIVNYIGLIECKAYGILTYNDGPAGVSCLDGQHWPGFTGWSVATNEMLFIY